MARARKRQAAYSVYLRGPVWAEKKRLVRERSGGYCEVADPVRCFRVAASTHHTRYPQTLGTEPIEWLLDVCDPHHDLLESASPWRQARRQALARSKP